MLPQCTCGPPRRARRVAQVIETCDDQMIGSVANLAMLQEAGMLGSIFKPVIAASIEKALSGSKVWWVRSDSRRQLPRVTDEITT